MTRKRRRQGDPIEHEIELALNPGAFIPDRACFSFVSDLDEVAAKIDKLIGTDPTRAVNLYETFLAACYVKIEELDDSSGSFGQLVGELYFGWIKARQADDADPDETASRLLTWMDQDNYGLCYHLEVDAVKVFNKANLAAFVKLVRARFDEAALSNFESAKRCFKRAGLEAEWNKTVSQLRADHHRKRSFMPGFERLVEGTGPSDEPSFLDQAKARRDATPRRGMETA